MIKLENVTKVYKGDVVALRDGSFEIDKGEFVFLVGPSGSGKSTLLRLLNREEEPQAGHIYVAGKDIGELSSWKIPYLRRNIGCVYQDYKLLQSKNVYENVAFALAGHRPAPPRDQDPGPRHPRAGRPGQEAEELPRRALRR